MHHHACCNCPTAPHCLLVSSRGWRLTPFCLSLPLCAWRAAEPKDAIQPSARQLEARDAARAGDVTRLLSLVNFEPPGSLVSQSISISSVCSSSSLTKQKAGGGRRLTPPLVFFCSTQALQYWRAKLGLAAASSTPAMVQAAVAAAAAAAAASSSPPSSPSTPSRRAAHYPPPLLLSPQRPTMTITPTPLPKVWAGHDSRTHGPTSACV